MHPSWRWLASKPLRTLLVLSAIVVSGTLLTVSCSSTGNPETVGGNNGPPPGGGGDGGSCAHPSPGCGCDTAGQTASCGQVEQKSGTFVVCAMGTTTCDGSTWGACKTNLTIQENKISGPGVKIQSLGASMACGSNPCDPYCNGFNDTPGGFDASPLSAGEGGLKLPVGANACICNEPANGPSLQSNLPAAYQGLPASCTSGGDAGNASDNCNDDYHCVGTTCTPFTAAQVNNSASGGGGGGGSVQVITASASSVCE